MAIGKVDAIKRFFGEVKPVTNQELLDLRRKDAAGFDWMAEEAARQLGETLAPSKA